MRIGDALTLKWKNIQGERLIYQMRKTRKVMNMKIVPQSQQILSHYNSGDCGPEKYVFPFVKESGSDEDLIGLFNNISSVSALINKNLKTIGNNSGIKKKLSTHIARHSFGKNARKETGDIVLVQESYGHSSSSVTENYIGNISLEELDDFADRVYG